jgi:predicted Zn finger-like uncharacterized protein
LYTRCTYCGSIYSIDAQILRQAAGQVRCGICEQSFDALRLLSESYPDGPPSPAEHEIPTEASIADLFGDRAIAAEPVVDAHALDIDSERPLSELTDELEGLVDQLEDLAPSDELTEELDAIEKPDADPEFDPEALLESTEEADDGWPASEPMGEDWWTPGAPTEPVQVTLLDEVGAETPDMDAGESMDAEPEPPYLRPEEALAELDRRSRPRLVLWLGIALFALSAAAVQWVHAERQTLVLHPVLGPRLTEVYRLFGIDLHPDWDPELLRVERTEMVSHPSIPGALYLSGVLSNEAPYALPLPTLRLRMDNRWGDVVAAREFRPADYLASPRDPEARFASGERVALGIQIVDPDPEAVGFRVQVCLPADGGERCR